MTGLSAPPETLHQASAWDAARRNASAFGLCHRCASQLAWAHQQHTGGFSAAHPPCTVCAPVVASLPVPRLNGWRTVSGSVGDASNWPISSIPALPGTPTPGEAVALVRSQTVAAPAAFRARQAVIV